MSPAMKPESIEGRWWSIDLLGALRLGLVISTDALGRAPTGGGTLRSGGEIALASSKARGVGSSKTGDSATSSDLRGFWINKASWFSLGGGTGGGSDGTERDISVDLRGRGGDWGTGGGAALGVEANGAGGGGGAFGGASLNGDMRLFSSKLDSRSCADKASLWGASDAISVS